MNLSKLIKPQLDELRKLLNLTEDERQVFDLLAKGLTIKEIALKIGMSTRTVDNRIYAIRIKMEKLERWKDEEKQR